MKPITDKEMDNIIRETIRKVIIAPLLNKEIRPIKVYSHNRSRVIFAHSETHISKIAKKFKKWEFIRWELLNDKQIQEPKDLLQEIEQ